MLVQVQNIKTKSELQSSISKLNVSKSKVYESIDGKTLDAVVTDIKRNNPRRVTIVVIEGN
jgi:hypothetical protein